MSDGTTAYFHDFHISSEGYVSPEKWLNLDRPTPLSDWFAQLPDGGEGLRVRYLEPDEIYRHLHP